MTLFQQFASTIGMYPPANAAQKDLLLMRLNLAATEIYNTDPPGCLREMIVKNNGAKFITIPANVGQVRAIRGVNGRLDNNVQVTRYAQPGWDKDNCFTIRNMAYVGRRTDNYDHALGFNVRLKVAEAKVVTVTLTGETASAASAAVEIIFQPGERVKQCINPFVDDFTATKDVYTLGNVEVCTAEEDPADEIVVAEIFNDQLASRYIELEVGNKPVSASCVETASDFVWEILYKPRWDGFVDENDTFPVPNCDSIILYKAIEIHKVLAGDKDSLASAQVLNKKMVAVMDAVNKDDQRGKDAYLTLRGPSINAALTGHTFLSGRGGSMPSGAAPTVIYQTSQTIQTLIEQINNLQTDVTNLGNQLQGKIDGEYVFATVAAMKAATTLNNGMIYATAGRDTQYDGNGSLWRYNSTSTATDDGINVVAPNSNIGRFILLF